MALALTLTIPAAATAQANLTGPWEVTIDSPQGAMTIDADLKQEGEALTGVITSPMGTVELKGTFKNDELSFSYTVPLQGQNLDITMTGKLAGDNIDGLVAIAGLGEVPWKAKRKAPGSAPAAAPAAPAASAGGDERRGDQRQVGRPHGHARRPDAVHRELHPDRRQSGRHHRRAGRRHPHRRHDDRQRAEARHERPDAAG
jgi:autotransporter translocation and assembly factor TamB